VVNLALHEFLSGGTTCQRRDVMIDEDLGLLEHQIEHVASRVDEVEQRQARIEGLMAQMDQWLTRLAASIRELQRRGVS
jgi:hypothetical protein